MIRVVLPSGTQVDFPNCIDVGYFPECVEVRKNGELVALLRHNGMIVCLKPEEMHVMGQDVVTASPETLRNLADLKEGQDKPGANLAPEYPVGSPAYWAHDGNSILVKELPQKAKDSREP